MGGATEARFIDVLERAITILEKVQARYVFIGGVAAAASLDLAWEASGADIDVLIHPDDVAGALDTFRSQGFAVQTIDPTWLHKAALPDVTIDLITKSRGGIWADPMMVDHAVTQDLLGIQVRVPCDEDLLLIKCIADMDGASHWRECLRMVARKPLDWSRIVERSEGTVATRVTSLALYCVSEGVHVPRTSIDALIDKIKAAPGYIP